jgi:phosphoribosylformimino-5-aminoimidazole carboxamide ribotide isomerase
VRVIGVIDLAGGRAVHARGGDRRRYAPVHSALLAPDASGDALALGRAYRDALGLSDIYAADLDAIGGRSAQRALVRQLAAQGPALWLDAGVSGTAAAARALKDGAGVVIVGLETLSSFDDLAAVVRLAGSPRVAFSLDLRGGAPLVRSDSPHAGAPAATLAARAADAGAGALIVLDVARVGGGGIDVAPVEALRRSLSGVALYAGGGVRGPADLTRLANAGCDGALVATALHDGVVGRRDVERLRQSGA